MAPMVNQRKYPAGWYSFLSFVTMGAFLILGTVLNFMTAIDIPTRHRSNNIIITRKPSLATKRQLLSKSATQESSTTTTTTTTTSTTTSSSSSSKTTTAIFMNAYISPQDPTFSLQIVQEQLEQLTKASNHHNNNNNDNTKSVLYYNIIGHNHTGNLCPPLEEGGGGGGGGLDCRKLAYYATGHEEVTLQALHDHCDIHPHDFVVYLHNKGSLHSNPAAIRNRRLGTKAVLSEACTQIMMPPKNQNHNHNNQNNHTTTTDTDNSMCNVCSFKFLIKPFSHIPGNFWAAKCDYIRQLTHPLSYDQSRRDLCQLLVQTYGPNVVDYCPNNNQNNNKNKVGNDSNRSSSSSSSSSNMDKTNNETETNHHDHDEDDEDAADGLYGFGRMAMERWISSHPSFIPCTVIPDDTVPIRFYGNGFVPSWTPVLQVAKKNNRKLSKVETDNLKLQSFEYMYLYSSGNHHSNNNNNNNHSNDVLLLLPPSERTFCNTYFQNDSRSNCPLHVVDERFQHAMMMMRRRETRHDILS